MKKSLNLWHIIFGSGKQTIYDPDITKYDISVAFDWLLDKDCRQHTSPTAWVCRKPSIYNDLSLPTAIHSRRLDFADSHPFKTIWVCRQPSIHNGLSLPTVIHSQQLEFADSHPFTTAWVCRQPSIHNGLSLPTAIHSQRLEFADSHPFKAA